MSVSSTITQDLAALDAASSALASANATLAADQAQVVTDQATVATNQSAFNADYQQLINDLASQYGAPPAPSSSGSSSSVPTNPVPQPSNVVVQHGPGGTTVHIPTHK